MDAAQPEHQPIERFEFDAAELMAKHAPDFSHSNKKVLFDIACPRGCLHQGRLVYTRWEKIPVVGTLDTHIIDSPAGAACRIDARPDVYDYRPVLDDPDAVEWHVNFADPYVFSFYASDLMAQDEIQVAEHPGLAALREALVEKSVLLTEEDDRPTPILVTGVQRRCHFAFDRNPDAGRPDGLYGYRFQMATPDVIARAVRAIDPPTVSHILAMAAPRGGPGPYTRLELSGILDTAYTGFRAAVLESARVRGTASGPVVIHSGFWGCGAFGGNRTVMILLQMMAASLAGADCLVLHTVDEAGLNLVRQSERILMHFEWEAQGEVQSVLERVEELRPEWGVSDGN